jgi:DNA-directed RNA polymerase specialized sigma24 family protein
MSVRVERSQTPAQRAEVTVNANYEALQDEVIAVVRRKLSARNMHLDHSDLEEAYCQAWHGVCVEIKRGGEVQNLTGMLVDITWKRAVDAYRGERPSQYADVDVDQQVLEIDIDEQLDDQAKLKRFIGRLKGRLNQRECEAVSLCLIHGYSRPEARELLGIEDEARMQKLMDGATKKIGVVVASITARGCGGEEWTRLLRAYALGVLTPEDRDYARAEEHIADCLPCKRYVMGLRGLAAIVPPVGLPFMPFTGHESSILQHLEHLFTSGHGTASAAQAGTGTAAAGSGGTLISSIGAGTAAKGVAVLAIVAATAAVAVKPGHTPASHRHRHVQHAEQATITPPNQLPASIASQSSSSTTGTPETAGAAHSANNRRHSGARHRRASPRRGVKPEAPRSSYRTAVAPAALSPSTALAPASSAGGSANVTAVEKEFGPEH